MKKAFNNRQYGVFIDTKKAILVSIDDQKEMTAEDFRSPLPALHFAGETTTKTGLLGRTLSRQPHVQRKTQEDFRKWCKTIVAKMVKASQVYIFGPSEAKYILQHEVERRKTLQNVFMEVETTDKLNRGEVLRQVKAHYRMG